MYDFMYCPVNILEACQEQTLKFYYVTLFGNREEILKMFICTRESVCEEKKDKRKLGFKLYLLV